MSQPHFHSNALSGMYPQKQCFKDFLAGDRSPRTLTHVIEALDFALHQEELVNKSMQKVLEAYRKEGVDTSTSS